MKEVSASGLSELTVAFFHLTWHMVTIFFLFAGLTLGYLTFRPDKGRLLGLFIGVVVLAWTVAVSITGLWIGWSPATIIPLIATLLIGLLSIFGSMEPRGGP